MTITPVSRPAALATFTLLASVFLLAAPCAGAAGNTDATDTLLIEPETFTALGPWMSTDDHIQSGNIAGAAFAGFRITRPGDYRIWTRSRDYPNRQPGARRFLLKIDERPLARESGAHGHGGWYWENVGTVTLDTGIHILEIDDTARFFGRLEAILITSTTLDPNTRPRPHLDRFQQNIVQPARVITPDASLAGIAPPRPVARPHAHPPRAGGTARGPALRRTQEREPGSVRRTRRKPTGNNRPHYQEPPLHLRGRNRTRNGRRLGPRTDRRNVRVDGSG
jgi:hypothetical protein